MENGVTDAALAGDGRQGRDRKAHVEAEPRIRTGAEHVHALQPVG